MPVSLTVSPIRDDEGRTLGYIGVAYDISDRLAYEQGLRGAGGCRRGRQPPSPASWPI